MARPLRIEYPGAVYHITTRGNARQGIYDDDSDRRLFLGVLASTVERYNWICHAYCLMDNHYHLLLETPDPNLSLGMRHLNGVYTQSYNRQHNMVGHIFQGRFKSILVEKEAHLLELCRYIVLNPVTAGMVTHPSDYIWSSYSPTAHSTQQPEFLHCGWLLAQFSPKKKTAQKRYRKFIQQGISNQIEKPWKNLVGQIILGGETFIAEIREMVEERKGKKEIPKTQRYLGRPSLAELFSGSNSTNKYERNKTIHKAHFSFGYTLKEIADYNGIHYTTVSRVVSNNRD